MSFQRVSTARQITWNHCPEPPTLVPTFCGSNHGVGWLTAGQERLKRGGTIHCSWSGAGPGLNAPLARLTECSQPPRRAEAMAPSRPGETPRFGSSTGRGHCQPQTLLRAAAHWLSYPPTLPRSAGVLRHPRWAAPAGDPAVISPVPSPTQLWKPAENSRVSSYVPVETWAPRRRSPQPSWLSEKASGRSQQQSWSLRAKRFRLGRSICGDQRESGRCEDREQSGVGTRPAGRRVAGRGLARPSGKQEALHREGACSESHHTETKGPRCEGLAGQDRPEGGALQGCGSSYSHEAMGTHVDVVAGQML